MHGIFNDFIGVCPGGGYKYMQVVPQDEARKRLFSCISRKERNRRATHEIVTAVCCLFQGQKHSGAAASSWVLLTFRKRILQSIMPRGAPLSIIKLLLFTKDLERLPTVKLKHLFCPLQVSGSEGISGISSEGERQQLEAPGSWPPWGPVLDSSHQDHPSSSRTASPRLLDRGDLEMISRIPLRLRGHPDRLHQWGSSTSIPAEREKIRLEQPISIPVTAWSTRLWNTSTFYSFCSFYLPWNYSTAIHLHLMSLINFVPTSKPSTGLSWSSTVTLSNFIRSP